MLTDSLETYVCHCNDGWIGESRALFRSLFRVEAGWSEDEGGRAERRHAVMFVYPMRGEKMLVIRSRFAIHKHDDVDVLMV